FGKSRNTGRALGQPLYLVAGFGTLDRPRDGKGKSPIEKKAFRWFTVGEKWNGFEVSEGIQGPVKDPCCSISSGRNRIGRWRVSSFWNVGYSQGPQGPRRRLPDLRSFPCSVSGRGG